MPIYEYKCEHCQDRFEAIRKIVDADEQIDCPACHRLVSNRLITAAMAFSNGHAINQSSQSCVGCSSGNCGNCGH